MPIDGGHADVEHLGNFGHCVLPGVVELAGLVDLLRIHHSRTPPYSASCSSRSETSIGSFTDQIPLELCECAHDREEEPTVGRGGVDTFREAAKTHPLVC